MTRIVAVAIGLSGISAGATVLLTWERFWAPRSATPQTAAATDEPAFPASAAATDTDIFACDDVVPPEGMVCIPAGPAVIGADGGTAAERPRHQTYVSTFFIDSHEVTNGDYRPCERAGVCPKRKGPKSYRRYMEDDLPVIPATWEMANKYCVWAGKRLPTEAEWEKAARGGQQGRRFPWGDEPPSCERASYAECTPHRTRPVGSFPPGAYGLYDLAGNGYEWVNDWASDCYAGCERPCGEACLRDDPQGPCDGAPECAGHTKRVLKGGSWYWPADQMRGAWRRSQRPTSGIHRLSFRCAASTPYLTGAPLWHLRRRPAPERLRPPLDVELAIFHDIPDDDAILTIPECDEGGTASHSCRDPTSYIKSNEGLRPSFAPYIRNLGGGYVGIGADQNYDFIAEAKSQWVWLFDYDPTVVRTHQILRAVVPRCATPAKLAAAFAEENQARTRRWIRASLRGRADEIRPTMDVFRRHREGLFTHYTLSLEPRRAFPDFGWLANQENYRYIRTLFAQGRVSITKGNLLTDVAMPAIARSARILGVRVRIFYSSNAADQWELTSQYRDNVADLPFDSRSVALRTHLGRLVDGFESELFKWLYVVDGVEHLRRVFRRRRTRQTRHLMVDALPTSMERLFTIGLPRVGSEAVNWRRQPSLSVADESGEH